MKTFRTLMLVVLLSVVTLAQQTVPTRVITVGTPCECPSPITAATSALIVQADGRLTYPPPDECSRENLLAAVQKAAKQLPDESSGLTGFLTISGGGSWSYGQPDKYAGKTYIERLDAIAADKEAEAKEARRAADAEKSRVADIKLIQRLAKECAR